MQRRGSRMSDGAKDKQPTGEQLVSSTVHDPYESTDLTPRVPDPLADWIPEWAGREVEPLHLSASTGNSAVQLKKKRRGKTGSETAAGKAYSVGRHVYSEVRQQYEKIAEFVHSSITKSGKGGEGEKMPTIDHFMRFTSEGQHRLPVSYNVECDVTALTRSVFPERPKLGSLIVVTGTPFTAYATTCRQYLNRYWADSGESMVDVLERALDFILDTCGARFPTPWFTCPGIELRFKSYWALEVVLNQEPMQLAETGLMLCWLTNAMDTSRLHRPYVSYKAGIAKVQQDQYDLPSIAPLPYSITKRFTAPTNKDPCWLPMFGECLITTDFPIPERHDEIGLEIDINLAANLIGVLHAFELEGGIVLKGYSSMLIPVKRSEDRIQWHLVTSGKKETRLSYADGLKKCKKRALLREVDFESLMSTRAFIGWCPAADTLLGSDKIEYGPITYSGATEAKSYVRFMGLTAGVEETGILQAHLSFAAGGHKSIYPRAATYLDVVRHAERYHVLLYDVGERRAWLFSVGDVILHILRFRNKIQPFRTDGVLEIQQGPHLSTVETLRQNASVKLGENGLFQDQVLRYWTLLEFLMDQRIFRQQQPGVPIKGWKTHLYGYDLKDVALEDRRFSLRKVPIHNTHGGWRNMIAGLDDCVVLFANGLGDLIKPSATSQELCTRWLTVPQGEDYMTTTVKTLAGLREKAVCNWEPSLPLPKFYLCTRLNPPSHSPSPLFGKCSQADPDQCKCDRTLLVRRRRKLRKLLLQKRKKPTSALNLEDNGAVVLGKHRLRSPTTNNSKIPPTSSSSSSQQKPKPNNAPPMLGKSLDWILPNLTLQDDMVISIKSDSLPTSVNGAHGANSGGNTPTHPKAAEISRLNGNAVQACS
ncbi:hypothetical protein FQN50_007553 [Emmonsiellopsis sp. PD_5]|nr:hypothetical protein FQN50_007553 [Emmonsiellopsis sp. PD_5]